MTEACQEATPKLGDWGVGERYGESIIKDLNNWTEGWIDWNLVLDLEGGPNHAGNYCTALIIADIESDELLFQSSYYYMGHFSRYIKPGAFRVACASNRDSLEVTAFLNPDGTLVTVVMNRTDEPIKFWLERGGSGATKTLAPAHSITTFRMMADTGRPPRL
ncbi:unnamed protein product [Polarella glacialis]|uniref:Glucosylceramidase n=1 Tax=Polarella glacialis TaxID=89957 RepID=A0A813IA60_POLGL|nr:unnamed protein product [Polarella glacialis]